MSEKSDWEKGYDQAMMRTYGERKALKARIAELEAYIDELVKAGDGMQRSLNAYLDYTQGLFDYKCYAPEDATSKWQALVKDWKEG